jgi:hypothetical protein
MRERFLFSRDYSMHRESVTLSLADGTLSRTRYLREVISLCKPHLVLDHLQRLKHSVLVAAGEGEGVGFGIDIGGGFGTRAARERGQN